MTSSNGLTAPDLLTSCGLAASQDTGRYETREFGQKLGDEKPCDVETWDQWSCVVETLLEDLQTNTPDVMAGSLRMIESCLIKSGLSRDSEIEGMDELTLAGSVKLIREAMMRCPDEPATQEVGCRLLYRLMETSEALRDGLQSSAAHMEVVGIICHHEYEQETVYEAMKLLSHLTNKPNLQQEVLYSESGTEVISCIVAAMDTFPQNPDLQIHACEALGTLLKDQTPIQEEMVEHREYTAITNALRHHSDNQLLVRHAANTLQPLVHAVENVTTFIEDCVHFLMITCCKKYHRCRSIMEPCFSILETLTCNGAVCGDVVEHGLVPQFLSVLTRFPESATLQANGFRVFANLAEVYFRHQSDHEEEYWLQQLYSAMAHHREEARVQVMCGLALVKLLARHPELIQIIGDNPDKEQIPLHIVCLGALLVHYKEAGVFESACDAIYAMSEESPRLRESLMERNVYIVILMGMRFHKTFADAQEIACRALRGLCKSSLDNKEKVAWSDALVDALDALRRFRDTIAVQIEAVSLVACLTDTEVVRTACIEERVYRKIMSAADYHRACVTLQEVTFEALGILCGTEDGCRTLLDEDIMVRVIDIMDAHMDQAGLQRKGLVLLQLLGNSCFDTSHPAMQKDLARTVANAMRKHTMDKALQEEGCVAMQILAEGSESFSKLLVEYEAHERLFSLLETEKNNSHIQDIASECLYVLCCVRDLKTQMLQYASAKGLKKGVECLVQLGAEVNVGTGLNTPLCHACKHNDEEMVTFLLQQGASDLQMALRISLVTSSPRIVGLLLKEWGYDRQNLSLSLNGLMLGNIHPDWLKPTVLGPAMHSSTSDQGKDLAAKVRNTALRRSQRMKLQQTSFSDTEGMEAPLRRNDGRRMSLRYPVMTNIPTDNVLDYVKKQSALAPKTWATDTTSDFEQSGSQRPLAVLKKKLFGAGPRRNSKEIQVYMKKRPKVKKRPPRRMRRSSVSSLSLNSSSALLKSYSEAYARADTDDAVSFLLPDDGLHEWERVTISGSNVPFSPLDPRQSFGKGNTTRDGKQPGEWHDRSELSPMGIFNASTSIESAYSDQPLERSRKKSTEEPARPGSPRLTMSMKEAERRSASTSGRYERFSTSGTASVMPERPRSTSYIPSAMARRTAKYSKTDKESGLPPLIIEDPTDSSSDSPAAGRMSTDDEILQHLHKRAPRNRRSNTLSAIPDTPVASKTVQELCLSGNDIKNLSALARADMMLLLRLQYIEKLDVHNNSLQAFPEDLFQHFRNLTHLNLSHNHLRRAPAKALTCNQLEVLDVSYNQISELSDIAYYLCVSMKEFYVDHNELKKVPLWLSKPMPNLKAISFAGNKIKDLPAGALKLKKLTRLDLSFNYIKTVPEEFLSELRALEALELNGNDLGPDVDGPEIDLECLPSEDVAKQLDRLSTLKMTDNRLTGKEPFYLPKFILALPALRFLDLSNNNLTGLPEPEMWKTRSLREIKVHKNQIAKLRLENAKLWTTLEGLYISQNKLTEVPDVYGKYKSILYLQMPCRHSSPGHQQLPKEIGLLTGLQRLDFSYNELSTIPDELGNLDRLYEMPLAGLKLDLDPAMVPGGGGCTVKDLIRYLQEKLKKCIEYYHMKLMVLGFSGKGKSTLLRALTRKRQPHQSLSTVGITVRDWKSSHWRKNRMVSYTLTTWDFAGQEEFYSTHHCFMSRRALYLVVYNLTGGIPEIQKLKPWLVCIQAQAPKCPVILVGTHLDKLPKENRRAMVIRMQDKLTEIIQSPGFSHIKVKGRIELDCSRENSGVDRLRGMIKDVLDSYTVNNQPVMGIKIPASYVRLQDLLTEECRHRKNMPIINHQRLLKIVKDARIELDERELQQAIRFLHESGVILHYEDVTLKLKDLYFINPGWLCRMMAQVVTVREINPFIGDNGILQKKAASLLFTGRQTGGEDSYTFPSSLIPQYLRILEKFEIVLPQNDDELLIPCRLPRQRPNITLPATRHGYIVRSYHMSFVPLGFWSRLITRLLVFTKTLLQDSLQHEFEGKKAVQMRPIYWRQGFYVFFDHNVFFLLEAMTDTREGLEMTMPRSRLGGRLLGQVVDHVDALIDEWYPGLTEVGPTGDSLLQKEVPCPRCTELNFSPVHQFDFDSLVHEAELSDTVVCPVHGDSMPLTELAPDVVLGDLESKFTLVQDQFIFVMSPENLLGDGCSGRVYRARYKNETVAVKVYSQIGDISPHKLLRQEVSVLRRLNHPSLMSLIAVGLHPWMFLLELAPLGSLGSLMQSHRGISRTLQHRMAIQIADGLEHLHQNKIIYRDLKPDNILVFSLSHQVLINVKISDYGIARFSAAYGLALSEGTPGYQAPEVSRGEPYSFKADVYSFGVTLYELVTGGKHPFDDLTFRNEFDEAVRSGRPIDPITEKGAAPWPDLQVVLDHCLQMVPEDRSDSTEVLKELSSAELLALKTIIPVSKDETIECISVKPCKNNNWEVWMASGSKECAQVSWVSLASPSREIQGTLFTDSRILCMATVAQNSVLVGTQSGKIWVYDAIKRKCKYALPQLDDAVLCIQHVSSTSTSDSVFVGLANGMLGVFDTQAILRDNTVEARCVRMGTQKEPVKCMAFHTQRKCLYVGAGANVNVIKLDPHIEFKKSWKTDAKGYAGGYNGLISDMCLDPVTKLLCIAKKGAQDLEFWHIIHHKLTKRFALRAYMKRENLLNKDYEYDGRVTAMTLAQKNHLWIGTGSGHLLVLDTANIDQGPLIVMHRYTCSVRAIATAVGFNDNSPLVLTGGMGFRMQARQKRERVLFADYGCLAVWDAELPQKSRVFEEDQRKRREWGKNKMQNKEFITSR